MSRNITDLHPRLQTMANNLITLCANEGIAIKIGECLRTVAEQDALYAKGRTVSGKVVTNCKGSSYSSMHQWGIAFDIFLNMDVDGDGSTADDAFNNSTKLFNRVGAIGQSIGLEWGGGWNSFKDLPHFQLPDWGSSPTKLKAAYGTPTKFIATWGTISQASPASTPNSSTQPTQSTTTTSDSPYKQLIKALQSALNNEYGAGLVVDGIPGPKTLNATPTLNYKTRASHPQTVKAYQNLLIYNGISLVADGDFYNKTKQATIEYQRSKGSTADGEATAKKTTWKNLLGL